MVTHAWADEPLTRDYQAFLNARGEAPWINANANHPLGNEIFRPIPSASTFPSDPAKRDLGFLLFHDGSLSSNGGVACSSCHMGMMGAADGRTVARGIDGALGERNTSTVINSAFNFRQFWDGRAFDLDEQALAPITNPVEMGHDLDLILDRLRERESYVEEFDAIYPEGLTAKNLGNAIAEHSKNMTRTDSPFNDYLNDSTKTLNESAQRGQVRFQELGCSSCHNGINLGGNSYQALVSNATLVSAATTALDIGLAARSGRDSDVNVFKVPQLHNVALTAPYFHDGSVPTLEDAIKLMGQYESGRTLEQKDVNDIAAFLNSLSSSFFSNGMRGMNQQQMQNSMHQQIQDQGSQHMMHMDQREDHQQHMMHMRSMQDNTIDTSPNNQQSGH